MDSFFQDPRLKLTSYQLKPPPNLKVTSVIVKDKPTPGSLRSVPRALSQSTSLARSPPPLPHHEARSASSNTTSKAPPAPLSKRKPRSKSHLKNGGSSPKRARCSGTRHKSSTCTTSSVEHTVHCGSAPSLDSPSDNPPPATALHPVSCSHQHQDSSDDQNNTKNTPSSRKPLPRPTSPTIPRSVDRSKSSYSAVHFLQPNLSTGTVTDSATIVAMSRKRYKTWFVDQENDPGHPSPWKPTPNQDPSLEVAYPTGRTERFLLLVPTDEEDEYRPIEDILNVIATTLAYYLSPQESLDYFSEPDPGSFLMLPSKAGVRGFSFLSQSHAKRRACRSPPPNNQSSPQANQHDLAAADDGLGNLKNQNPTLDQSHKPLLKSLWKAFRRQNGPEFWRLVQWFNCVIKSLSIVSQSPAGSVDSKSAIEKNICKMRGLNQNIWESILGQSYDRQVGPRLDLLRKYETWSSNVYGELRPSLVSQIVDLVQLKPDQVFVDLGSGVGNIVLQVGLQVGCVSVGFEIMQGCSTLAKHQSDEVIGRSRDLWNVSLGQPILLEADFTTDSRVGPWLKQANVILVNNQVFTPTLNESIKMLFLELNQSTKIVSLKPFIGHDFKVNSRNFNSIESILRFVGEYEYRSGSVSWTDNSGKIFVCEVDRNPLIAFKERAGIA